MLVVLAAVSMVACADEDLTATPARSATATVTVASGESDRRLELSRSVQQAIETAALEARAAGSSDAIPTDTLVDVLLRDERSSASRALVACGSEFRPDPIAPRSATPSPRQNDFVQMFSQEAAQAFNFFASWGGSHGLTTTGHYLYALLVTSPGTAVRLGVTPEAYLDCLQAALSEAPEP